VGGPATLEEVVAKQRSEHGQEGTQTGNRGLSFPTGRSELGVISSLREKTRVSCAIRTSGSKKEVQNHRHRYNKHSSPLDGQQGLHPAFSKGPGSPGSSRHSLGDLVKSLSPVVPDSH
jgi:hypothetical protein